MNIKYTTYRLLGLLALFACTAQADTWYVSPTGLDSQAGTKEKPFKTISRAREVIRDSGSAGKEPITVNILSGRYFLEDTIVFTSEDSGSKEAPIVYQAQGNVTVSSGRLLDLEWASHKGGILKAKVSGDIVMDQLFVNDKLVHMARYPNYDQKAKYFNGYSADCLSQERVASWDHPQGGYIHALHKRLWGSQHYLITGKDSSNKLQYKGGWQHHWQKGMHEKIRFVENIFEELDVPDEWYFDHYTSTLYYYPPADLDPRKARFESVQLSRLIEFKGSLQAPVRFITVRGINFTHASRTFMKTREPLNWSDWSIYRNGALFLNGTENCAIENCVIRDIGGNAVFVNNYNKNTVIRGCHVFNAGASGVAFVGDSKAAWRRSRTDSVDDIAKTPGPRNNNYPQGCLVEDCLMHDLGRVEKQVAGVHVSMAQGISVRHCSIYTVPRAGINISDGCWGGNLIEFCDVFDTVRETSDHGSFNSWGRDRFFKLKGLDPDTITTGEHKGLPLLDMVKPTIIRNSRWSCARGWGIDLDDGSSSYEIYNNLCLKGGIKLREGFYRKCYNNIMVNNTLHPHVWFSKSEDVVERNIMFRQYRPVGMRDWGRSFDNNLVHSSGKKAKGATSLQKLSGKDKNSITADAMFIDTDNLDYRVKDESPALKLGFINFPMDRFGVTSSRLKALARRPGGASASKALADAFASRATISRMGLKLRVIQKEERSAWGVGWDAGGLHVLDVTKGSPGERGGLKRDCLIISVNGVKMRTLDDLRGIKERKVHKIVYIERSGGADKTVRIVEKP